MNWVEQNNQTKQTSSPDKDRVKELEEEKATSLPEMLKEVDEARPFEPIKFQPVKSPGIYEAEFASKGEDQIFHFWPYGYHEADRRGVAAPKFSKDFEAKLRQAMSEVFQEHRLEVVADPDVGSWFVRAKGWGSSMFSRELSVKACKRLHELLGGAEG